MPSIQIEGIHANQNKIKGEINMQSEQYDAPKWMEFYKAYNKSELVNFGKKAYQECVSKKPAPENSYGAIGIYPYQGQRVAFVYIKGKPVCAWSEHTSTILFLEDLDNHNLAIVLDKLKFLADEYDCDQFAFVNLYDLGDDYNLFTSICDTSKSAFELMRKDDWYLAVQAFLNGNTDVLEDYI